jgi:protease-4
MIVPRSHISAVELSGTIGSQIRASEYARVFDWLREDRRVKSVLLIVDSPGGSATDSGYLQSSVARLAEVKPVVAFVQGMAASGGYMASSPATKIVALPSALVGSIGVISVTPILSGLLDRLGINVEVVKSGRLKDMGSFHREPTDEERRKEQELSDEFYDDFVDSVVKFRRLERDKVKNLATGEVFTAKRALQMGLVDELGDHNRAIELASQLGDVPKRVVYIRPRKGFLQRLFRGFASSIVDEVSMHLENQLLRELRLQVRM